MQSSLRRRIETSRSFVKAFGFQVFCQKAINAIFLRPFRRYLRGSFSQNYEDLIVDRLLDHKSAGFYVDVGANDPVRSNNTMRFYRRGWSGINIEPDANCSRRIAAKRPRDVILNIGIAREHAKGTFHSFLPETRSTFSEAKAEKLIEGGLTRISLKEVDLRPLAEVLDQYARNTHVDFISIDTEGYDEQVLLSNDWNKYKPLVICIESRSGDIEERLLVGQGYERVASTPDNFIYKLRDR